MKPITVSFFVANNPVAFYQSEVLLLSIRRNSQVKKKDIVIVCSDDIENSYIQFLDQQNYNYIFTQEMITDKSSLLPLIDNNQGEIILLDVDSYLVADFTIQDKGILRDYSMDNMGYLGIEQNNQNKKLISDCNKHIASEDFTFMKAYRAFLISTLEPFENKRLVEKLSTNKKIIFHVGAPKTGTTSLQYYLEQNRDNLFINNVQYATNISSDHPVPKHQWMVKCLLEERYEDMTLALQKGLDSQCSRVIFSTEGIVNHWFDFSQKTKTYLCSLAEILDIEIVLYVREIKSFMYSLYKQNLKNGKHAKYSFGSSIEYNEFLLQDQWFRQHANYYSLILELQMIFGVDKVKVIPSDGNTIDSFMDYLGLDNSEWDKVSRKNVSQSNREIEWLRNIINANTSIQTSERARNLIFKTAQLTNSILGDVAQQVADEYTIQLLDKENDYLKELLDK